MTLVAVVLTACAAGEAPLPPPPAHQNGQALWSIVHDRCVPGQLEHGRPEPCVLVTLEGGTARGYAVLKDRNGATQYLLLPTDRITGIEDPKAAAPGATNYFGAAWAERRFVEDRLGRPLRRDQMSVAVNSAYGRSQDQLHLHIDCLDASVGAALQADAAHVRQDWSARLTLKGRPYRVRWVEGEALASVNPLSLLAADMPGAARNMGAWTLAIAGGERGAGVVGFYLMADRAHPQAGDMGSSEELQDHSCRSDR